MRHLLFALLPIVAWGQSSSLRGRVVDPEGHPVPRVDVQLLGIKGNWVLTAVTGPDGRFLFQTKLPSRIFVMRAVPKDLPPPSGDVPMVWAPTYYPGTPEFSGSPQITWRSQADLDGYEIKLCAVPVYHVRGTVVDETGQPVEGASIKLLASGKFLNPEAAAASGKGGSFDLPGVRPGEWLLEARWKRGEQELRGITTGRVSRGDWDRIPLRLEPPFSLTGMVEAPPSGSAHGGVALIPADDATFQGANGTIGADGHFEIRGVHAGRYHIVVSGMERRFYLDSLQLGGQEVLGHAVRLENGALAVRAVYRDNSGKVQGAAEHCVVVSVFPTDAALRDPQFIRNARCDAKGRFEIGGLRPGEYYVVAFSPPEFESSEQALDEILFDPEILASDELARVAETVQVESGQATTAVLELKPWPES